MADGMTGGRLIRAERADGVVTVFLDRPDKRNAMNPALLAQLEDVVADLRQRDDRAVVLASSSPGVFSAGADLAVLSRMSADEATRFSARSRRTFQDLEDLQVPVIAAVDGHALAGGFELVLACTLAVASTEAVFGLPEVTHGITPGAGGTERLPRLIGMRTATELILTGRRIGAAEAHRLGIVNRLVDPGSALTAAHHLAHEIAGRPPAAVRYSLAALRRPGSEPAWFGLSVQTEDARRNIAGFLGRPAAEEEH